MSSEIKKKSFQVPEEFSEEKFDVKTVIIPFSLMFGKKEEFIYNGEERMAFSKRQRVYRELFLNEFTIYVNPTFHLF